MESWQETNVTSRIERNIVDYWFVVGLVFGMAK